MSISKRSIEERRSSSPTRAVLIAVESPERDEAELERSLAELEQLLLGLGVVVAHRVVQRRTSSAPSTYLGEGKLREVAALTGGSGEIARGPAQPGAAAAGGDLLVVADDELGPSRMRPRSRRRATRGCSSTSPKRPTPSSAARSP